MENIDFSKIFTMQGLAQGEPLGVSVSRQNAMSRAVLANLMVVFSCTSMGREAVLDAPY